MLSFHGNFQQQKLMQLFSVSINILIEFNIAFRSLIALNQLCAAWLYHLYGLALLFFCNELSI